uniref:Acetylserotonin O-methyltransferase-like n=1 Tax=Cyprinus carpio TaxID=7962 RepID=A0A8C2HQG6_CYPCA
MIFCPENCLVKFVFSFHLQTVDGLILEMPTDKQDAYRMLSRLSGKERRVFTGVAIVLCHDKSVYKVVDFYEETKVKFAELSEEILTDLSVLDRDMAGVYGIQTLGGMLVEYVQGDFLNLVGFPLNHFCKQLGLIFNTLKTNGLHDLSIGICVVTVLQCICLSDFIHITFASKLKAFDVLNSSDSLTLEEVAGKINASVLGTERLLGVAVSLGLLERVKQQNTSVYRNTEQASHFLVSDSPETLHVYILQCNDMVWPLFSHLESAVREGTSHITRLTGKNVATAFDLSPYKTACDIGDSSELANYRPISNLPFISKILEKVVSDKLYFFKDDLPKADLYILARILHDWSDEKLHVLLSIRSKMCTPGKKRPSRALLQALSMTEGKQRITTEYRDLLEKHGFTAKHIKHADNLLDAMLFLKEDSNDKRTLLGCSSASIATAELE